MGFMLTESSENRSEMSYSKEWADLHGEDEDARPCRYWENGYPSTYSEPGESGGCGNPAHCSEHWKEVLNKKRWDAKRGIFVPDPPIVECPHCHQMKTVSDYSFDSQWDVIVASPEALCEDCIDCLDEDEPPPGS